MMIEYLSERIKNQQHKVFGPNQVKLSPLTYVCADSAHKYGEGRIFKIRFTFHVVWNVTSFNRMKGPGMKEWMNFSLKNESKCAKVSLFSVKTLDVVCFFWYYFFLLEVRFHDIIFK